MNYVPKATISGNNFFTVGSDVPRKFGVSVDLVIDDHRAMFLAGPPPFPLGADGVLKGMIDRTVDVMAGGQPAEAFSLSRSEVSCPETIRIYHDGVVAICAAMAILSTAVPLIQESCTPIAFEKLIKANDHFNRIVPLVLRMSGPLSIHGNQQELVYAHPFKGALYDYENITAAYREHWDFDKLRAQMETLMSREGLCWLVRFSVALFRKPVFMQVEKPTLWELIEASGHENRTVSRSPEIDALDYAAVDYWPLLSEVQMGFVAAMWRKVAALSDVDGVMRSKFMFSYLNSLVSGN